MLAPVFAHSCPTAHNSPGDHRQMCQSVLMTSGGSTCPRQALSPCRGSAWKQAIPGWVSEHGTAAPGAAIEQKEADMIMVLYEGKF